jgi:signal transduction histidine kinase
MAAGVLVPGLVATRGQSGEVAAQIFTLVQLAFVSAAVLRHRVWGMVPMTRGSLLRVMAATDNERRRVRAELHDGVGAGITAIRLKVDAAHRLVGTRPERASEMLDSASSDLGAVLADVRAMVEGLRPAVLDRLGLAGALQRRAEELSSHAPGLTVTLAGGEHLGALPRGADVAVYGVVTEALNNVLRHSGASTCRIHVRTSDEDVVVEVLDDGGGSGTTPGGSTGVGLVSMSARAAEVGGYVIAGAGRDQGYRVQLVIPRGTDPESTQP